MKIVVLDGYAGNPGDLSWDELRKLGDLTIYDRTPSDRKTILERIGDAELVFTNPPLRRHLCRLPQPEVRGHSGHRLQHRGH